MRVRVLGDIAMAQPQHKIPLGGKYTYINFVDLWLTLSKGMNEHAIYEAVGQKRQRPSLSGLRKLWCPDIVELIDQMWAQDPQERPTMTEVVEEVQRIIKEYR